MITDQPVLIRIQELLDDIALPRHQHDVLDAAACHIERLTEALEDAAQHFEEIERKALYWMQVCASNEMAESRWSQIKRHAGHRAREIHAALRPVSRPLHSALDGEDLSHDFEEHDCGEDTCVCRDH